MERINALILQMQSGGKAVAQEEVVEEAAASGSVPDVHPALDALHAGGQWRPLPLLRDRYAGRGQCA